MYRNAIDEERQRAHDETISDEHYWRTVVHEAAHCVIAERLQPGAALERLCNAGRASRLARERAGVPRRGESRELMG